MAESQKYYLGGEVIYKQFLGTEPSSVEWGGFGYPAPDKLNIDASNLDSYPTSGSLWKDLSPNDNDVILSFTAFSTDGSGSIDYNSTQSQGVLNSTENLTDTFTSNIWFKIDNSTQRQGLLGGSVGGSTNKVIINFSGDVFVRLVDGGASTTLNVGFLTGSMIDEWHMLTIARDESDVVWGSLDGNPLTSSLTTLSGTFNLRRIGATADGNELNGHLSTVLISSDLYTDDEVLGVYNNYKTRFGY